MVIPANGLAAGIWERSVGFSPAASGLDGKDKVPAMKSDKHGTSAVTVLDCVFIDTSFSISQFLSSLSRTNNLILFSLKPGRIIVSSYFIVTRTLDIKQNSGELVPGLTVYILLNGDKFGGGPSLVDNSIIIVVSHGA